MSVLCPNCIAVLPARCLSAADARALAGCDYLVLTAKVMGDLESTPTLQVRKRQLSAITEHSGRGETRAATRRPALLVRCTMQGYWCIATRSVRAKNHLLGSTVMP